jgi:chemotaxis protein histidine kinase CheA
MSAARKSSRVSVPVQSLRNNPENFESEESDSRPEQEESSSEEESLAVLQADLEKKKKKPKKAKKKKKKKDGKKPKSNSGKKRKHGQGRDVRATSRSPPKKKRKPNMVRVTALHIHNNTTRTHPASLNRVHLGRLLQRGPYLVGR